MKYFYVLISIFSSGILFSQSKEKLKEVIENTNVAELKLLKEQFQAEYLERQERINDYLLKNPTATRVVKDKSTKKEMYDVLDGKEVLYYVTSNAGSSATIRTNRLYSGGALGLNVQGQGMKGFVWDGGGARTTHVEFPNNKVNIIDGAELDDHATHVTGTIAAQGLTATLKGIAFDASVDSYDWNNDYAEMADEAADGMLVSNHSYWIGQNARWVFGAYDSRARSFDLIAFNAPFYLGVTAAGNDRNDFGDALVGPYLSEKGGYNLVRGMQNGKNFLTVGAVNQVSNYTSPESVVMSSFSSWGPTDDGRIKPEIVAKGVNVRSTLDTSDTASGLMSGTSMASPAVTGAVLLMQQHYHNTFSPNYMRAATVKGLLLHTADEAGAYIGPDYEFGWGLLNAEKAATLITNKNAGTAVIDELTLTNGQTYTRTISANGSTPLFVSISWTDRAGTANNGTNDLATLNLVNDLDVRVVKTDNTTYFPWTLDPSNLGGEPSRAQDNFRDNYEKVQVDNPNGTYNIVVTHKGTLTGGSQNFSLIVSGPQVLSTKETAKIDNAISIYPNPVANSLNFAVADSIVLSDVSIYDVTGKMVISSKDLSSNSIDVSRLQSGVYFAKFASQDKTVTKKFIKQ
ncbi:S8 family serine peptidase [Flavobacterium microcysteis]|uniref:T9SS type A sorting domain-containing protein n=1 Tax=Flavobacterium microcysteis TaxID=2596891 RepID=A0A501Q011_9FLAO|nr:S8 family serine peptidase [Flavobacterium microcysteis]TPD65765.1 T9SS type A sorting domain-containing protein [Flavobacterium microcysteis]